MLDSIKDPQLGAQEIPPPQKIASLKEDAMCLSARCCQDDQHLFISEPKRNLRGMNSTMLGNIPSRYPYQFTNNAPGDIQNKETSRDTSGLPSFIPVRYIKK